MVQSSPRPSLEALANYYAEDYRGGCCAGADVADVEEFPKDNLFYYNRGQSIAELLSSYIETDRPRILDIGAGFGHILYALGERYPEAPLTAIEFSDVCVKHLESLGIEVHDEPAEDVLPRLNRSFDVVVISHVFEHLLDPRGMLEVVRSHLSENGLLYIEVPNIPEEAMRRYPDHVWAPRFDEPHITFFSKDTLAGLLRALDFDVEFCDTAGPEYKFVSSLRYRMPTMRWFVQGLIPPRLFHFLRRQKFTQPVRVKDREDSFYRYGGMGIWIRTVSRNRNLSGED